MAELKVDDWAGVRAEALEEHRAEAATPTPAFTQQAELVDATALTRRIITDRNEPLKPLKGRNPTNSAYYVSPNLQKVRGESKNSYLEPEFDQRVGLILEDVDSFVYMANFRRLAQTQREKFSLGGHNEATVAYIEKRFRDFRHVQGRTMWSLFSQVFLGLYRSNNAFLIKIRSKKHTKYSRGRIRKTETTTLYPVAGYEVVDASTMFPMVRNGRVTKWMHQIQGDTRRTFQARDVIHFQIMEKPHTIFSSPQWNSVEDDIRGLRSIEEYTENLIYQNIQPLYIYTVGTKEHPTQRTKSGRAEVQIAKEKFSVTPDGGMIFLPYRHAMTVLGSESKALRVEGYLQSFRDRVIVGTGMSGPDFGLGQTANKSTTSAMSKGTLSNIEYIQQVVKDQVDAEIIEELLDESSFKFDLFSRENIVTMRFPVVDKEARIAVENHEQQKFLNNLVTRTEAREVFGNGPKIEEEDTFHNLVTIDSMDKAHENALETAENAAESAMKVAAATPAPSAGGGSGTGAANASASRQQPSNQHGKRAAPRLASKDMRTVFADAYSLHSEAASVVRYVVRQLPPEMATVNTYEAVSDHVKDMHTEYLAYGLAGRVPPRATHRETSLLSLLTN